MASVSQSPKKERESRVLAGFQRASGLQLRVLDDRREAPDFIVEFEGRQIGLEVTELFSPRIGSAMDPQARTSIGARITQGAWKRYMELGGKPVHVSVHLTPHDTLRDINRDLAAERLAQFVLALDPPLDKFISWRQSYPYDSLPQEIFALHILAVPDWNMALWTAPEAGWISPLNASTFQAAIDDKSKNLESYKQVVPEIWLLLATLGMSASQLFELERDFKPESIQTPFARTYYLAGFEGRVVRLGAF